MALEKSDLTGCNFTDCGDLSLVNFKDAVFAYAQVYYKYYINYIMDFIKNFKMNILARFMNEQISY